MNGYPLEEKKEESLNYIKQPKYLYQEIIATSSQKNNNCKQAVTNLNKMFPNLSKQYLTELISKNNTLKSSLEQIIYLNERKPKIEIKPKAGNDAEINVQSKEMSR